MPGIKGLLSPQVKAMLRENLRHTITIVRAGAADKDGEPTIGEELGVPCLISGARSRVLSIDQRTYRVTHSIEFPPGYGLQLDDTVKDGRDRKGALLLAEGTVVAVEDLNDADMGQIGQSVSVALN